MDHQNSAFESYPERTRVNSFESDGTDPGHALNLNSYHLGGDMASDNMRLEEESADELPPLRDPPVTSTLSASHGPPPAPSSNYVSPQTPSASTPISAHGSYGFPTPRSGRPSSSALSAIETGYPNNPAGVSTPSATRPPRPSVGTRTPSHAYAPPRRPSQFSIPKADRKGSTSSIRARVAQAEADYRAQKKLYIQRLQQDIAEENATYSPEDYPPSLGYSGESEDDSESPGLTDQLDKDPDDTEALLYYGNEETQPSVEELKIPENRERLEWHSMLANVLTGDVVSQEKRRLYGAGNKPGDDMYKTELWTGVRAKCCGRTIPAQKRMVEDQRTRIAIMIEEIINFEIKGETVVGKTSRQQVEEIVQKIEKIEGLYRSRKALQEAHPRAASVEYNDCCDAIISWHNTTELINTQLGVLQAWVGNEELDFSKSGSAMSEDDTLADDSTFIERIQKEDGLKPLQGDRNMLIAVDSVIEKAKQTLIRNAGAFSNRHLPPYIEELLTLINFPSRLVQEIIRMRLANTKKMKGEVQQGVMMADQMISQFRLFLNLAQKIKTQYNYISQPEPGWDLPPCVDENFDTVVLDALRFYFKMLNWKLSANRNTFKEAEILEQEWDLTSKLGKHFQGGDVEIAERFSALTSKSLLRLTTHFERELERKPDETVGEQMDRRYRQIFDSVRVRQRKLFRFSKSLSSKFESSAEYSLPTATSQFEDLWGVLIQTGHVLVEISTAETKDMIIIASPSLQNRPKDIASLLGTAYRDDDEQLDPADPYLLILAPEEHLPWDGESIDVDVVLSKFDVKPGKMRLVAECIDHALQHAQANFLAVTGMELDVVMARRANLASVDKELQRIRRTAYKLSNSIMESVEHIRNQLAGLDCHELIQTCFVFATEFGQRSLQYMDHNARALNNLKLSRLALDWVSFICNDCPASERKTFRWAVTALEFAMLRTQGQNILSLSDEEYSKLREKVSGCMSLLISHFDIMGARSLVAAQADKTRLETVGSKSKIDVSKLKDDDESAGMVRQQWLDQLASIDDMRKDREAEIKPLGRVLENSTEADRSLMLLSAYATNVTLRWQQGQYIGGGTFGSVFVATNIDSGHLMAVKEIRLHDPQIIPKIVNQIRDEMSVLQILSHDNIVSYHGIEVHRDKVYIFMEYCSGGSLGNLLEHGRIEDETVVKVYALQLLEGLAYLHESGVVHRDIKPENILLDHNGVIKYVDFGAAKIIARQTGRTLAKDGQHHDVERGGLQRSMTGTPMYMSPESIRGSSSGGSNNTPVSSAGGSTPTSPSSPQTRPGAADIWSLGCVVLEMATGRRPWATLDNEWAIMYNIAQGNTPALPSRDQLSEQGIDFLKKCFERDPLRRASAVELLQHEWIMELRNMLNLEPSPATPSTSDGASFGSGGLSHQDSSTSSG